MAVYGDLRKKEHAFQTIEKDMKAGTVPHLLLLCGEEQYLVHWAAERLTKAYVKAESGPMDFTRIEAEDFNLAKLKESCETLSMLSAKRVVLLPDFPPATGEKSKYISQGEEKELLEYLQDIPETCLLIITAKAPDQKNKKKSKLQATIEKAGKVYDFTPLSGGQLQSFIAKRFKASDKVCRDSVVELLIETSGYGSREIDCNLYNLENDIKKIIAHSTGDTISPSDVALTVSAAPEINVFAMLDAVGSNRKEQAYRLLHNLLANGERIYSLLALIISQLELILDVKEMSRDGMSLAQIQKTLGIHQFRIKKALGLKDKYSEKSLKRSLRKAYEVDESIKTGLLSETLALELFLAEL